MFAALARRATGATYAAASRGMKVKASVKKICEHCRLVKRERVLYVYCDRNPKHKQVIPIPPHNPARQSVFDRRTSTLIFFFLSQRQGMATLAAGVGSMLVPPLSPIFA